MLPAYHPFSGYKHVLPIQNFRVLLCVQETRPNRIYYRHQSCHMMVRVEWLTSFSAPNIDCQETLVSYFISKMPVILKYSMILSSLSSNLGKLCLVNHKELMPSAEIPSKGIAPSQFRDTWICPANFYNPSLLAYSSHLKPHKRLQSS